MRKLMELVLLSAVVLAASNAHADNKAIVERAVLHTTLEWRQCIRLGCTGARCDCGGLGFYSHTRGGKGAKGMIKTLEFFGSVIPDLKWTPQELLKDGDRYIVRRIATGTPRGKFSVSSGKLASRS